jgi:hypothetical protein
MTDNIQQMLKRLLVAIVFSIAFGYIESAVVVDLRAIFHPNGFHFPCRSSLRPRATPVADEIGGRRDAGVDPHAGSSSRTGGRPPIPIIFAVWDIFYYVWLKAGLARDPARLGCLLLIPSAGIAGAALSVSSPCLAGGDPLPASRAGL